MPRTVYAELGWESRRLTLLLPIATWKQLDARASSEGTLVNYVINGILIARMGESRLQDRVSLTPLGEAAVDATPEDLDPTKWGKGGSEW